MSSKLNKQNRLAFWCQKVLPLVYDESLSYYELLGKVVKHLNDNTDAINVLIEFFNNYAVEIKEVIEEMLEDGELDPVIADVLGALIASPYDESKTYILFDYCIYGSKLYRANASTTGEFDTEKWDEKVLADDISTLENRVYGLTANHVAYDSTATYDNGTTGKAIKELENDVTNLDANDVAYNSSETYDDATVGKELVDLKRTLSNINLANVQSVATANEDLDNYTDGGIWFFGSSYTPTNKPTGSGNYGFLISIRGSSTQRLTQIWIDSASSANDIYTRTNALSPVSFSAWKRLATSNDITKYTTIKTITPTITNPLPSGVTACEVTAVQAGNVVQVAVGITRDSTSIGTLTTIASGLPIPKITPIFASNSIPLVQIRAYTQDVTGYFLNCTINSSGELRINRGETAGSYRAMFTYLTDDFSNL